MSDFFASIIELLVSFAPLIIAFAGAYALEVWRPWRPRDERFWLRAAQATILYAVGVWLVVVLFPGSLQELSDNNAQSGLGLLPLLGVEPLNWSLPVLFVVTFCLRDLLLYTTHWTTHKFPFLWRMHRVHHSDIEIDASTALRDHPIEIIYGLSVHIIVFLALGIPGTALGPTIAVSLALGVWVHTNTPSPKWMKYVALVLVTPDYHRRHHSAAMADFNCNLGNSLTIWDRLFGTVHATFKGLSTEQNQDVSFGCPVPDEQRDTLIGMLLDPFQRELTEQEIAATSSAAKPDSSRHS